MTNKLRFLDKLASMKEKLNALMVNISTAHYHNLRFWLLFLCTFRSINTQNNKYIYRYRSIFVDEYWGNSSSKQAWSFDDCSFPTWSQFTCCVCFGRVGSCLLAVILMHVEHIDLLMDACSPFFFGYYWKAQLHMQELLYNGFATI